MALKRTTAVSDTSKKHIEPLLIQELISSEESAEEGEGEIIVRPLPWRDPKITEIFLALDRKHDKHTSVRSKKMSFIRKQGLPSDRPEPNNLPQIKE